MNIFRRTWLRLRNWARRLVGKPPEVIPGRSATGATWSGRGWLSSAPWVPPRRAYLLHIPGSYSSKRPVPLVVWLHGCKQSPEEFRDGTRITRWADERGLLVLMPRQWHLANGYGCWNWFDPATFAGGGETALVLEQIEAVCNDYAIQRNNIFLAGMSSGASLAAALVVHAPQRFAAAAFCSGLACGAARSSITARDVMTRAPDTDVAAFARLIRLKILAAHWPPTETGAPARANELAVPALVIHGADDSIVARLHARELVRQLLAVNGEDPVTSPLREADARRTDSSASRAVDIEEFRIAPRPDLRPDFGPFVRLVSIRGLGHAWSGGDAAQPFQDASPPDATQMILDFFRDVVPPGQTQPH